MSPGLLSCLRNVPLATFVEVEQSFSRFKEILTDRRHNFVNINSETTLIVNFSAHVLSRCASKLPIPRHFRNYLHVSAFSYTFLRPFNIFNRMNSDFLVHELPVSNDYPQNRYVKMNSSELICEYCSAHFAVFGQSYGVRTIQNGGNEPETSALQTKLFILDLSSQII